MDTLQLSNVIELLKVVGEQDDMVNISVSENNVDSGFEELGYDSLALMSVVAQIEKDYGIDIGFTAITQAKTPRQLFELMRGYLTVDRKIA